MAYSYVQYTGNNATTNYAFSFPYLDSSHIKVRVDGVITAFTFVNSGTVQISPAPLAGKIIDIRRETPKDIAPVNFTDGSVLLEQDLDLLAAFNLYTAQESADGVADAIVKDSTGVWDAQSRRIKSVADPVNANDAVNKTWAETAMSSQLASATTQATISTTRAGEAAASASSASTSASTATSKAGEASASATSASNSATSATASAATATTKASEALASQVAAAASASTASTKASEANTSAGNAAGSASTATTQAGIATTKATEASNSASAAATSASTATTKADSAAASATSAAASAATATTKAAEADSDAASAATSASNAASSATSAAAQVALATTQATNSANSATASAASASDSANSATSAAASAASAAAILDNFDDRYLGSKSSAPTVDNDGNALLLGALYFDSTTGKMRVYTASGWIDASSASVATLGTFKFTATGGQTSFSGTGDTGIALSYTVGAVIVSLNGVLLEEGSEFTASTGTSIVLASGASAGDELNVYAFGNFLVADTYSRAEADAKYVGKTSTAGAAMIPAGTTAQRPTSPEIGYVRFNTSLDSLENYTALGWLKVSVPIPVITSVSGTIFNGVSTTLTLTGLNFGVTSGTVTFSAGGTTKDVVITPSSTSATVVVPSEIYSLTIGTSVSLVLTNGDGGKSGAFQKVISAMPSGGTVTTSGSYRIHTFNSSSSFTVPNDVTLTNVEYLIVAGGGGNASGAGGNRESGSGAGGYRSSVTGEMSGGGSSAESKLTITSGTHTITVGAGGSGHANGANSSAFGITSIGGGTAGQFDGEAGSSGGSGGGGWYGGAGGSGTSGQGYSGSTSGGGNNWTGGGGGDAGGSGYISGDTSYGGSGVTSSITGSSVTRATGGRGNRYSGVAYNTSGAANTGDGASGIGNGGSGVVIVRYQLS